MGQTLENPHDGQNSSCHTEVLRVYLHRPELSTCPSRMGTLGSTNLPQQHSVLEQSYPEGRPDTCRNLMARHWFIISTQRQQKKYQKKKTISLQPQNRLSLGHLTKELSYPHSLEEIRDCLSVMASDFMAPGAEEPSCTITQTLQPNVLWPAGLEMMKSIDFCFPEGTATLSCGLKEPEVSYNQRFFFNSITDYFRLFLVSVMAPLELCKVGLAVSAAPGFAGGEYKTQSHYNFKIL